MTLDEFERAVKPILTEVAVLTLATTGEEGVWATDVYFAASGWDLLFFSSPQSRHCRNLAENPACAATVHPAATTWLDIKGLQMAGQALPLEGADGQAKVLADYLMKFPFVKQLFAHPGDTLRSLNKTRLYRFSPSRIWYLDNALGFGTRYSIRLSNGQPDGLPQLD